MSEPKKINEIIHGLRKKPTVLNGMTNIIAVREKMRKEMNDNICGNCVHAHFPNGHCKIQSGKCYMITTSKDFYVDVLRNSKGCEYYAKKKKGKR